VSNKIVQRISRETGVENLLEILATSLPGSDLQPLLLEVYQRRATGRSCGEFSEAIT